MSRYAVARARGSHELIRRMYDLVRSFTQSRWSLLEASPQGGRSGKDQMLKVPGSQSGSPGYPVQKSLTVVLGCVGASAIERGSISPFPSSGYAGRSRPYHGKVRGSQGPSSSTVVLEVVQTESPWLLYEQGREFA
eukprot:scaffold1257_cov311-Pavlova_lutheri.AAC.6